MSLATVAGAAPSLGDLVDGLACRTGAWVLVERFGAVVAHGAGAIACPPPLAEALLHKRSAPLRAAVRWSRGRGAVDGVAVVAVELGEGATAWFVGAAPEESALPLLALAARGEDRPVTDAFVHDLLHPHGPSRPGQAPPALLVVLRFDGPLALLSQRANAVLAGTGSRVHTESDHVVLALPVGSCLVEQVLAGQPGVVAGTATVAEGASDWVTAARLAGACARAAASLGLALGSPDDPRVAGEVVVQEAHEAVADLVRVLPDAPLRRLQEHDARGSGELVRSLRAWCRSAFDVGAAAAELHVHPNTLRYRLKRATEVSGLDVSKPRQLLALQLLLGV